MSNTTAIRRDIESRPDAKTRTTMADVMIVVCAIPAAGLMLAGFVLGMISN